ncbi:MAG: PQQ-binding-like beta-propeller repeat protein [Candidatus Brocadiia bacterium]
MGTTETERQLVALPRGKGRVYLNWRLLPEDDPREAFHVERRFGEGPWQQITKAPVTEATEFTDTPEPAGLYRYRVVSARGPSRAVSMDTTLPATNLAVEFALVRAPSLKRVRMAVGDLDDDGRCEFLVLDGKDGRLVLTAYTLDGEVMWEAETGLPAAGGWDGRSWHVPFMARDVNDDGRTEVVFHTAGEDGFEGDYYERGEPHERLVAVDGQTGETVWQAPWPGTHPRVMLNVGRLRGDHGAPSVVVVDGTYGDELVTAVDGATGQLQWQVRQERPAGHNVDIGDVDDDGRQEVIVGGVCYRGDGTVLWQAEPFGHTDVSKPARYLPDRPGLQTLFLVESHNPGVYLVDQGGRTIWQEPFGHAHWCWIGRHEGCGDTLMIHAAEKGEREYFPVYYPDGRVLGEFTRWQAHHYAAVGWRADGCTAFINRGRQAIVGLDERLDEYPLPGAELPTGTRLKDRNHVCLDIVGDYREEYVGVDYEKGTLFVAANPQPARRRAPSPNEDPAYRRERSQFGTGYYTYLCPPAP